MPGTAREEAGKAGIQYLQASLISDPSYNMQLGNNYFERQLAYYGGSYPLAVAAYNAGPGNVNKWLRANGDPRTSGPGFRMTLHESELEVPFTWNGPKTVFVNTMSDLFHKDVPLSFLERIFDVMGRTPQHTYHVLTKRSKRLAQLAPELTWHIATLSKCATPALRLAYVVAPSLAGALQVTAQTRVTNLMAPPLMAGLATTWIKDGTMERLTASIRRENRARQAIAATALKGFFYRSDPEAHHLWLSLPKPWAGADFSADARKAGLAIVGSEAFAVGEPPAALRISLGAAASQEALRQGLNTLAAILSVPPRGVPGIV
jgi:hypothetical protein